MLFRHCGSRSPRPGSCHWRVVAGYNEGTKTRVWIIRCGRLNCNKTRLTLILSRQIRFLKTSCNWAEENEK
jgi:hypothetical protein